MRVRSFVLVAGAMFLLSGFAPGPAAAGTVTIQVSDFTFAPASVTIQVGDTVHWNWKSGAHSTTAVAGLAESWDSQIHTPPFGFDHTFGQVGTYHYYCSLHGSDNGDGTARGMSGTIVVGNSVAFTGQFQGTRKDRRGAVAGSVEIHVDTVNGAQFTGGAGIDGQPLTPVQGTLSAAGQIVFTLTIISGRKKTTYAFRGAYAPDRQSIAGSVTRKVGRKQTMLTFVVTREAAGLARRPPPPRARP